MQTKAPWAAASVPARGYLKNREAQVPISKVAIKTGSRWTIANYFDVESWDIGFSSFFLPPAKLGAGSFYLAANCDTSGQPLRG
jgi:hypothetical protein